MKSTILILLLFSLIRAWSSDWLTEPEPEP